MDNLKLRISPNINNSNNVITVNMRRHGCLGRNHLQEWVIISNCVFSVTGHIFNN